MLFELLFLIYLLPVILLIGLLLKAARWIIVNVFRLAIWIIKTAFVLLWKGLLLITGLVVGKMVANRNQTDRGRYN
ncbi:hypothetical protein [Phocaeicola sartorii]|jgi:hypothetical protein|uniref:hypothetical protein n=1 Tax=Phocaeicola sartorii TaxID=671267 RepID=UPI000A57D936|nr:hypothetical protein [Phocaeicola sartorii]MCR1844208.1 hypothetical protein [Phocaeicola sartorii]